MNFLTSSIATAASTQMCIRDSSKGPKPSEKVEVPLLVGLTKDQAEEMCIRDRLVSVKCMA